MNGEGIMGLPMGGEPMPAPAQGREMFTPEQASAIEFARSQTTPEEISNETFRALEQVDPALVLQLKQSLASAQLPPQLLEALKIMVDEILNDPASYQQLRAEILADPDNAEVLSDLLPPMFDPIFFTGLRVALDQVQTTPGMEMMGGMPVQGFAQGGIVELPPMLEIASQLQRMGRNGDTMLAHITPGEARMLKSMGGSGTINPYTGLPEFIVKKAVKAVTGAVKSVGKAVTGAVKGIADGVKKVVSSDIGRIALTIAGVYFLTPMVAAQFSIQNAALAAAVTSFGVNTSLNLASGMKPGDALKQGLQAGVVAGVTTGITQGFDAQVPGIPAEPGIPVDPGQAPTITPIGTAQDLLAQGNITEADKIVTDLRFPAPIELGRQQFVEPLAAPGTAPVAAPTSAVTPAAAGDSAYSITSRGFPEGMGGPATAPTQGGISTLGGQPPVSTPAPVSAPAAPQNIFERTYQSAKDFLSPAAREQAGVQQAAQAANQAKAAYLASPGATTAGADAVWQKTFESAQPGMLAKYGPIAGVGLGATALLGGFQAPPVEDDPLQDEREEYYESLRSVEPLRVGGGNYGTYSYEPVVATSRPYSLEQPVYMAKKGSSPAGVTNFPRKTGPIEGPGTGTSDSIPAMLSDGEFVFTAKAVRNFGNGSRRKGAARMYKLMKMLEGGPVKKDGIASLSGAKRG